MARPDPRREIEMFQHLGRFPRAMPFASEAEWPVRTWRRVTNAFEERRRRLVAWRELRSMDEHTMRDIGISHRAAAEWPRVRDVW
jgi:hypothetical protein